MSQAAAAGPEQVLAYLVRYTHRVAISSSRLVSADDGGIAFRWKGYRIEGPEHWKSMTLAPAEFIRRFMLLVLPKGFTSIASGTTACCREPRPRPRRWRAAAS